MAIGRTNSSGVAKYTHPSYTPKASGLYKVTVDASGHVSATAAVTKSDITALGIPGEDTKYTHPSYTAKSSGLYKVTVDGSGHVSEATAVTKSDITALGIPGESTTYSAATQSAAGLMSADDKKKLDSVASGANAYTHPSYTARTGKPTANATPGFGGTFTVSQITSDATGHVTGATDRTITIPSTAASASAAGLMSASDKSKLDGINETHNIKTYTDLAQIGLTKGSETIETIASALPVGSILQIWTGLDHNTDIYPTSYGELTVEKLHNLRTCFTFRNQSAVTYRTWTGFYSGSQWSGWNQVATTADIEAAIGNAIAASY